MTDRNRFCSATANFAENFHAGEKKTVLGNVRFMLVWTTVQSAIYRFCRLYGRYVRYTERLIRLR